MINDIFSSIKASCPEPLAICDANECEKNISITSLSLGHISRIEDNAGRKDYRGEGFELRTDGHGVARAAKGLVLSTEARSNAQGHVTDLSETQERLQQATELLQSLTGLAQHHQAQDKDKRQQQAQVASELQAQHGQISGGGGAASSSQDGSAQSFAELQAPHLLLSSPAGIESTTKCRTHIAANAHIALTSGQHTTLAVGKGLFAAIKDRLSVFVHQAGMKLIAGSCQLQGGNPSAKRQRGSDGAKKCWSCSPPKTGYVPKDNLEKYPNLDVELQSFKAALG